MIYIVLCLFFLYSANTSSTVAAVSFSEKELQKMAYSEEWLALGHYRRGWFKTYKSIIDSDNFFLASDGREKPLHELKATVKLFHSEDTNRKCFFPARFLFLKQKKLIDTDFPHCSEYETFKKDLNPHGITFIFTDAYMNNPASLFGHTLMRIDAPGRKTQLMAHGINYGAWVDEKTAGPLYALYGITGGYYGGFTIKPYYSVINMYNNMENRDIWEYRLNLTETEQVFYTAHLWEIGQTQIRYYFFTKNCSYLLMEVLDAVRPGLHLADDFPLQTVPLDTVKALARRKDIVLSEDYRPSRQRRIFWKYNKMSDSEKKALKDLLNEDNFSTTDCLNEEQKTSVLETAYEYVQYQWVKQAISLDEYRYKSFKILKKRRQIKTDSNHAEVKGNSPLLSHDSMRIQTATGVRRGKTFVDFGFRPAYHALTDPAAGLSKESEIRFLDAVIRYYPQNERLALEKLTLVKIGSFAPVTTLFQPLSYQIDTYAGREWNPKTGKDKLMYTLKGGSGFTFPLTRFLSAYGFVNSVFRYGGSALSHHAGGGFGGAVGFLAHYKALQTHIEGNTFFSDNDMIQERGIEAEATYTLCQNWAVGSSYTGKQRYGAYDNTFRVFFSKYF